VVLVLTTIVRVLLIQARGHGGDLIVNTRWAENLAQVGPWGFYDIDRSVYPALLYVLWPIGILFDGAALETVVKGLSIPFDVATVLLLYIGLAGPLGRWRALGAATLYAANPGVLIAGPMWGQVDAAGTLPFVASLLLLARSRFGWAGALAALAMLVKPQYGLVGLPLIVLSVAHLVGGRDWRPLVRAAAGTALGYLAVAIPLRLDPLRYADLVNGAATRQPMTSLYAPNPWGLFTGYDHPDGGFVLLGSALLVVGLAAAQLPLLRRRDTVTLLAVGMLIAFAFYFLPTRVHERYLFPGLAAAVPLAVLSVPGLLAYLVLSSAFGLSLVQALAQTTPWDLGEPLRSILVGPALTWGAGIALLGSAVVLVVAAVIRPAGGAELTAPPTMAHPGGAGVS
jgi:hypothetical protein